MSVNELDIQGELRKATITAGGYSFKMSNRFLIGVPDLFVQLPKFPTLILEVKFVAGKDVRADGSIRAEPTLHQARYINDIRKAGGQAGWVVVTWVKVGVYAWRASPDPSPYWGLPALDNSFIKQIGQPWPIARIVKECIQ